MKQIEIYYKQFEQLLQKIIQDKGIDEYDDEEVTLKIHEFESDKDKIAEIIKEKPDLAEFYSKPKPIQVVEQTEDDIEIFSEEVSMKILAQYLQEHPEFKNENIEESEFSKYVINRFRSITKQVDKRINEGIKIPYDTTYIAYDDKKDMFSLEKDNQNISVHSAMVSMFEYIEQRRKLAYFKQTNNIKGIEKIPEIYRKEPENINKDEFDELSL